VNWKTARFQKQRKGGKKNHSWDRAKKKKKGTVPEMMVAGGGGWQLAGTLSAVGHERANLMGEGRVNHLRTGAGHKKKKEG